jgi:prevent-host-death family protein
LYSYLLAFYGIIFSTTKCPIGGIKMAEMPKIVPISDLRQDAAGVLKSVRLSKHPLIITQRGRAAAIMVSIEAYEKAEHERKILESLARGEKDIAGGKTHDLDHVLAKADELLGGEEK